MNTKDFNAKNAKRAKDAKVRSVILAPLASLAFDALIAAKPRCVLCGECFNSGRDE